MKRVKYWLIPILVAVGISVAVVAFNVAAAKASTGQCWTKTASHTFGTWWTGYGQRITDNSTFCANAAGTKLVYRSTHVSGDTIFCSVDSVSNYKIAGAADGSTYYVDWVDEVHFTCPTNIPYLTVHPDDKIAMEATDYGLYKLYWSND